MADSATRTSDSHPIEVSWLVRPPPFVGLTFAPGRLTPSQTGRPTWQRDLGKDLDRLRSHHHVDALVCLLEEEEMFRMRIQTLVPDAERRGIEVIRVPVPDGGTPGDIVAVEQVLWRIVGLARAGKRVVIHCHGGLGRSGTLGACTLVTLGMRADAALERVRLARGVRAPENDAQREYVRQLAERWRERL